MSEDCLQSPGFAEDLFGGSFLSRSSLDKIKFKASLDTNDANKNSLPLSPGAVPGGGIYNSSPSGSPKNNNDGGGGRSSPVLSESSSIGSSVDSSFSSFSSSSWVGSRLTKMRLLRGSHSSGGGGGEITVVDSKASATAAAYVAAVTAAKEAKEGGEDELENSAWSRAMKRVDALATEQAWDAIVVSDAADVVVFPSPCHWTTMVIHLLTLTV